jgi:hypothetical protein
VIRGWTKPRAYLGLMMWIRGVRCHIRGAIVVCPCSVVAPARQRCLPLLLGLKRNAC